MTEQNQPSCSGRCDILSLRRRSFLGGVSGAVVAALWPRFASAGTVSAVALDAAPALKEVGGSVILKVKEVEILFIRDTESSVVAVHPICTHKKNRLGYDPAHKQIVCEEHGSRYERSGEVSKGPSEEPLTRFYRTKLDLENARVLVIL